MFSLQDRRPIEEDLLRAMNETLIHRGPDEDGILLRPGIGLAMRRLSIIDRSGGHQPLSNEDGSVWVVYNGEIYNFSEIREKLVSLGHRFETHSDTEVIVHAYEEYGEECLHSFNGMFAFALWDVKAGELFIVRDRLGVKPLYYAQLNGMLYFASEMKALLKIPGLSRTIDPEALNEVLMYRHVLAPRTIFTQIRALLPGHSLRAGKQGLRIRQYWTLPFPSSSTGFSEARAQEELRFLLEDAVRLRLISEVPLGAFLSGGLDSSAVVGLMSGMMEQPVKTFTVGFSNGDNRSGLSRYDERGYAGEVSKWFKTDHHEVVMTPNAAELLPKLIWHLDEPLADPAAIPTYLISRFARQHVTVVLTGEGADELFGGYPKYRLEALAGRLHALGLGRPLKWIGRLPLPYAGALRKMALPVPERWAAWDGVCSRDLRAELVGGMMRSSDGVEKEAALLSKFLEDGPDDPVARLLYLDAQMRLPNDLLMKVDKMSMAVSLEARVPFLDYRLVEFAFRLPTAFKVRVGGGKQILRKALAGLVPQAVLHRRKQGFSVPVSSWLRGELRPFLAEVLDEGSVGSGKLFDPRTVTRLLSEHHSGQRDHGQVIWTILNVEIWRRTFGAGL